MTIPAGWLRKWQSPLEHVGSLLCSLLSSGGVANIWMKWHQLEGFPLTYVLICHLGMIEQRLPPKGKKIFCERRLQRDSDVGVSTL